MKVILDDVERKMFLENCNDGPKTLGLLQYVLTARVAKYYGDSQDMKRQLTDHTWAIIHCFDEMPWSRKKIHERADVAKIVRKMFDVVDAKPEIQIHLPKVSPEADKETAEAFDKITAQFVLKFDLRWE